MFVDVEDSGVDVSIITVESRLVDCAKAEGFADPDDAPGVVEPPAVKAPASLVGMPVDEEKLVIAAVAVSVSFSTAVVEMSAFEVVFNVVPNSVVAGGEEAVPVCTDTPTVLLCGAVFVNSIDEAVFVVSTILFVSVIMPWFF